MTWSPGDFLKAGPPQSVLPPWEGGSGQVPRQKEWAGPGLAGLGTSVPGCRRVADCYFSSAGSSECERKERLDNQGWGTNAEPAMGRVGSYLPAVLLSYLKPAYVFCHLQ